MHTPLLKTTLTAIALAALPALSTAANYTWSGDLTDNWSQGGNWVGGTAPGATGDHLFFDGNNWLTNYNDSLSSVIGITFNEGAGNFVLQGNTLTLAGNIVNKSTGTQTLDLFLNMNGHRTIDTGYGTIIVNGSVGQDSFPGNLDKQGAGTLELRAHNTYTGITKLLRGTLILDASTGSIHNSSQIYLGDATNYLAGNGGQFEIKGGNYTHTNTLTANTHGDYVVKLHGNTVTFNSYSRTIATGTVNFDLTTAGSVLRFETGVSASNTIMNGATITKTVDGSPKTSFAVWNSETKEVESFNPPHTMTPTVNPLNAHYQTSGNLVLGSDPWFQSLTITGGGHMTESATWALRGMSNILMQEGSSDYRFSVTRLWGFAANNPLAIHQYSMDGTLIIDSQMLFTDGTGTFTKAGPGKVHLTSLSNSTFTGITFVQGGELQVDGTLAKTAGAHVYEGATLSGGGSLGSVSNPTATRIRAGGTLQATTSNALDITGSLTLNSESNYAVTLDFLGSDYLDVSGAVTIEDFVNLQLTLAGIPVSGSITLLQAGTLTGEFSTINGQEIGLDNMFSLMYNSVSYDFEIFHDLSNGSVYLVSAIPEPSTVALLAGVALAGLVYLRRRK